MKGKKKRKKTKTTIVMEKEKWKDFKKLAIDREVRTSQLLETVVKSYVRKSRRK